MKKYKNIILSLEMYGAAIAWYFSGLFVGTLLPFYQYGTAMTNILNGIVLYPPLILSLIGIYFGFKSNKTNESSWLGSVMILIGVLVILSPFILTFISYRI